MMEYKNIKEALEQLEKCKFIDEIGHPIENNVAFIYLKELSKKYPLLLGSKIETELNGEINGVNVSGKTVGYVHKLTYRFNQIDGNDSACYKVWADLYQDRVPHANNHHLKTILLWNENNGRKDV